MITLKYPYDYGTITAEYGEHWHRFHSMNAMYNHTATFNRNGTHNHCYTFFSYATPILTIMITPNDLQGVCVMVGFNERITEYSSSTNRQWRKFLREVCTAHTDIEVSGDEIIAAIVKACKEQPHSEEIWHGFVVPYGESELLGMMPTFLVPPTVDVW